MVLLGQNSVGGPSIIGQYLMFVRTGTHECTTALKPIHPGTVWGEKVYPKQLLLRHPYQCPSKIHHAGFRMQAFVTFEPLTTCPSGKTSNSWTLSICTVLSDRLAQKHRFNWAFPLCLVCIDLQLRCRTELTSLKKDQCCGLGCPLTVKKSVFIYVIIVTSTCTNTPVEMFDGNTTPHISLLAMIAFAMLVSIASTSS